ncbi:MAG: glycoside hydrolase family 16 protein [Propionibacteriaceae bacterium]|nr:glycoside hydrolase family 16 protein [Propionibacteriaceae bacterium]
MSRTRTLGRWLAAGVAGLLAGCSPAQAPPSVPSSPPTSSAPVPPPSLTSTPTPSAVAPLGEVDLDPKAQILIVPVDYDGQRVIRASFGKAAKGRPASLQHLTDAGWQELANGVVGDDADLEFMVPYATDTYRAVVAAVDGKPALASPSAAAKDQWRRELSDDFDGDSLDGTDWGPRNEGSYRAGGRSCSAPYSSNVEVADGVLRLKMTKETKASRQRAARAAGCTAGEYYRNAMISTESRYTLRSGYLAARVKFSFGQGMHGSVWLQSYQRSEIDMVESYGFGWGMTSVIHLDGQQIPGKTEAWIMADRLTDPAWWEDYHVYSAEWGKQGVVVRVDGEIVQRITTAPAKADYFLVVSLLSSDWELKRLRDPVQKAPGVEPQPLPGVMEIDWIRTWSPR